MAPFSVNELTNILARLLPDPHAGLLAGLLFGTKATLPKELYDQLVSTGTIHIIALSGMNITILIDLVASVIGTFVSKRAASVLTIGVIVWFVWFVGSQCYYHTGRYNGLVDPYRTGIWSSAVGAFVSCTGSWRYVSAKLCMAF